MSCTKKPNASWNSMRCNRISFQGQTSVRKESSTSPQSCRSSRHIWPPLAQQSRLESDQDLSKLSKFRTPQMQQQSPGYDPQQQPSEVDQNKRAELLHSFASEMQQQPPDSAILKTLSMCCGEIRHQNGSERPANNNKYCIAMSMLPECMYNVCSRSLYLRQTSSRNRTGFCNILKDNHDAKWLRSCLTPLLTHLHTEAGTVDIMKVQRCKSDDYNAQKDKRYSLLGVLKRYCNNSET